MLLPVWLDTRDDDAAQIVIGAPTGQPSEDGGAATFTVVLTSSPTGTVTVPVLSSDTTEGIATPSPLQFTAANWSTPRTVTVTGVEDAIADGEVPFIVRLGPTLSADLRYQGLQPPEVRLTNLDDGDAVGIVGVGQDLAVAETGTTQTFTVRLTSEPTSNVVLPVVSSDVGEVTASPGTLTFTPGNWSTAQTVTVRGVDDVLVDGSQAVQVSVGPAVTGDGFYAGLSLATPVAVTNADNDLGALVASVTGQASEAGGSAYLSVRLSAAPSDVVNVSIASGDTTELAVAPPSVSFTAANWQNAQTVELRGVDDALVDDTTTTQVTLTAQSGDGAFNGKTAIVAASTADDDLAFVIVSDVVGAPSESGDAATFTVRLATEPTANVVVTAATASAEATLNGGASSALTFTAANWATPRPVVVRAIDDALDDGDQAFTITFQVVSTDAAYNAFAVAPVALDAIDDDARAVQVGAVAGQPSELGGAATFSVRLASEPSATVTVTPSSSDTSEGTVSAALTFTPATWMTPQTVTVTGVDDGLQDGTQSYGVTFVVTGGDYAGVSVASVPMTTLDNDSGAGIAVRVISGSPTEAGGVAQIGVRLTSQPTASVPLAVASGNTAEGTVGEASLTFTSADWSQEKTVTVTGQDDALDDGDVTFDVTFDPSGSDPAYGTLATIGIPLVNVDNDAAGFVVGQVAGQPTEGGGVATFTLAPTSRPRVGQDITVAVASSDAGEALATPVSLTFTNADWAAKTVTVTGQADDLDDGDQAFRVDLGPAISADASYGGRVIPPVLLTNIDDDSAGITQVVTGTKTSELGATGPKVTILVTLGSRPDATVQVPVTVSDPSEASADVVLVTFPTSGNAWSTGVSVTIEGVDDFVQDGNVAYQVTLGPVSSNDPRYAGRTLPPIALVNDDAGDTVGISVSETTVTTSETGTSDTFTVVLTSAPTANVHIPVTSSDASEASVSHVTLEFTPGNWNIAQTVTVTGVNDDIQDGTINYQVRLGPSSSADPAYSGRTLSAIAGTNGDAGDTRGITLTALTGAVTESGGVGAFTVRLASEPAAAVTLSAAVTTNADEATVAPTVLTFTAADWSQPREVRITGRDDDILDGAQSVVVTLTPSGGDYGAVAAPTVTTTNADDDGASVILGAVQGTPSEAGGAASFTVRLGAQPSGDVTITITDNDADDSEVLVAATSLTFSTSTWATAQTVVITGKDDAIADGDQVVTLTLAAANGGYTGVGIPPVIVANRDNDAPSVSVRLVSGPTTEAGGKAQVRVRLNTQPVGDVVITASSSDTSEGTVSPASLTFTTADWSTEKTFEMTGANDSLADGDQSYLMTLAVDAAGSDDLAYEALTVPSIALVNVDDDSAGILVTRTDALTHETTVSDKGTITVALRSQPSAEVVVHFAVSDATEATADAASLTFSTTNWGTAQTITLTGVDDAAIDGNIEYAVVFADVASADGAYDAMLPAPVTLTNVDAGDVAELLVTQASVDLQTGEPAADNAAFQVALRAQPLAPVTVAVTSLDASEGVATPATLVFTPSNWSTIQTVTVAGVNDNVDDGAVAYDVRFGPTTAADPSFAGLVVTRTLSNTDDDTRAVVLGTVVGALTEGGGQATFSVVLTTEPTGSVTISVGATPSAEASVLTPSLTFTASTWNQPQLVAVRGEDDAVVDGAKAVAVQLVVGGGDYAGFAVADVALSNADDDVRGIVIGDRQGQATETGGQVGFSVQLTSRPTQSVTLALASSATDEGAVAPPILEFAPNNWNVPQAVVVTGADDDIVDGTQAFSIGFTATSADLGYDALGLPSVALTNLDDDSAGVTIVLVSGTPSEAAGQATLEVKLNTAPANGTTVRIPIRVTDTTEGCFLYAADLACPSTAHVNPELTFTSSNWNVAQVIKIEGVDDSIADGDIPFDVVFGPLVSADVFYDDLVIPPLTLTNVEDDDAVAIRVTPSTPTLAAVEAGDAAPTFSVVLGSQPTSDVVIDLRPINTVAALNASGVDWSEASLTMTAGTCMRTGADAPHSGSDPTCRLTFTPSNWATVQTVTVRGVADDYDDGDQALMLVLGDVVLHRPTTTDTSGYRFVEMAPIPVTVADDPADVAGITLTVSDALAEEGTGTAQISVTFATRPTSSVQLPLSLAQFASRSLGTPVVFLGSSGLSVEDDANWNLARSTTLDVTDDCFDDLVDGSTDNDATVSFVAGQANWRDEYANISKSGVVTAVDDDDASVSITYIQNGDPECTPDICGWTSEEGGSLGLRVTLATTPVATTSFTVDGADITASGGRFTSSTLTYATASNGFTENGACGWQGTLTLTGIDDAVRTIQVVPADRPDEAEPRVFASAPAGYGPDAWQGPVPNTVPNGRGAKSNWHARWIGNGNGLKALFPTRAAELEIRDLAEISYWTNRGAAVPAGQDWWIQIYTRPKFDGNDHRYWYGRRFISNFQANTNTTWQQHSTDGAMMFFAQDSNGQPTGSAISLATMKATYGTDLVEIISVQTDSGWNGFDGAIDGLEVELVGGAVGRVDFGSQRDVAYDADVRATSALDTRYAGRENDTVVRDLDNDVAIWMAANPRLRENAANSPADYVGCTPLYVLTRTQPFRTTTQTADGEVVIALTSDDLPYGGGFDIDGAGSAPLVDTTYVRVTATNWAAPNADNTVTVCAQDDRRDEPSRRFAVTGTVVASATVNGTTRTTNDQTGHVVGLTSGGLSFNVIDDDVVGITVVGPSEATYAEGSTATFTVRLDSEPNGAVVIDLTREDLHGAGFERGLGVITPARLTFTAADWQTPQTVSVAVLQDDIDEGAATTHPYDVDVIVHVADTLDTTGYDGATEPDVTIVTTDDDTASIVITPPPTVAEGDSANLTIALQKKPLADVTVALTVAASPTGIRLSNTTDTTRSVTIAPADWATPVTVPVYALHDHVHEEGAQLDEIVTAVYASADPLFYALADPAVTVVTTDHATDVVSITATSVGELAETNNTCATVTLTLGSLPWDLGTDQARQVVITATSSSTATGGTVTTSPVTIDPGTTWPATGTTQVCAANDAVNDDATAFTVGFAVHAGATDDTTGYDAATVGSLTYTPVDDDDATISIGVPGSVCEGANKTFSIVLTSRPTADVTIAIDNANGMEVAVSPESVTFTPDNWGTARTVSVAGIDDDVEEDDETFPLTFTVTTSDTSGYAGQTPSAASVTVSDLGCPSSVRVHVAPNEVPDEQQPRVVADAPLGFGPDAWQGSVGTNTKSNWHARLDLDGDVLSALFPTRAATLQIKDVAEISYYTKRPDGAIQPTTGHTGQDWHLTILTRDTDGEGVGSWYGRRFHSDYWSHTERGAWTLYSTSSNVKFEEFTSANVWGGTEYTLDQLRQSNNIGELYLMAVTVQTQREWNGFDGLVDGLKIRLTDGTIGRVDFGGSRQISVGTADVPDEREPRAYVHSTDKAPPGFGPVSWRGPASGKSNWYLAYLDSDLGPLSALFPAEPEGLRIRDIAQLGYATRRPAGTATQRDWWITLYTEPTDAERRDGKWYGKRFINNFDQHSDESDKWRRYSTEFATGATPAMTFRILGEVGVERHQPLGERMTLGQLITAHGTEPVFAISLQTDSGWNGFDGMVDRLEVVLRGDGGTHTVGRVDFGDVRTLRVLPADVPDEQEPRDWTSPALSADYGPHAWRGPALGKSNWYAAYAPDGSGALSAMFPEDAATLRVRDLATIDYATYRPDGTPVGRDWWVTIYTRKQRSDTSDGEGSWYRRRFNSNYGAHAVAGQWQRYSSRRATAGVGPITFHEFSPGGSYVGNPLTMTQLAASAYANDLVLAISVHTDSGWNGFDGGLEALEIGLTNGKLGRVDFAAGELVQAVPSDVPDEIEPRVTSGVGNVSPTGGASAWQGPPVIAGSNNKTNWHARVFLAGAASDGEGTLHQLFPQHAADLTLSDLASISYWTKRPDVPPHDWWVSIYTRRKEDGDDKGSWYRDRLTSNYTTHTEANVWRRYSTAHFTGDVPRMAFASLRHAGTLSLAQLGALAGEDEILAITVQTDSGTHGFDGLVDGLEVTLTDGSVGRVDFAGGSRLRVLPSEVPDEKAPRVSADAPPGYGPDAWQGPVAGAGNKTNWHAWYDANGSGTLSALFPVEAATLKVKDLAALSYWTKRAGADDGRDWWITIYTRPTGVGDDKSWYHARYINNFDDHTGTAWTRYTTRDATGGVPTMTFRKQDVTTNGPSAGFPALTLGRLAAYNPGGGAIGEEEILAITVQTASTWNGFDGLVDGLEITLKSGAIGKVDFGGGTRLGLRPSAVPDEEWPRSHPIDGPPSFAAGNGSWIGPAPGGNAKTNVHIGDFAAPGDHLRQLFGGAVKVSDLASLSYYTKRATGEVAGRDWWVTIYTKPSGSNDDSWYHRRYISNFDTHATTNVWTKHSSRVATSATAPAMMFQRQLPSSDLDPSWTARSLTRLGAQAPLDGQDEILSITLQTASGWNGFDGGVDGLEIVLKDGRVGRVDLQRCTGPTCNTNARASQRLVALQCPGGTWGWPSTCSAPAANILAPTAMGLAKAYVPVGTGTDLPLNALLAAGDHLRNKTVFAFPDGYLAVALDQILGVTTHTTHVKQQFYDKLLSGTYVHGNGTSYYTPAFLDYYRNDYRAGGNLAAWDVGMALYAVQVMRDRVGDAFLVDTAWANVVKAEVAGIVYATDNDIIGLAGAIAGLARANVAPTGPLTMAELVDTLLDAQIGTNGAFTWQDGLLTEVESDTQATAYAILALVEAHRDGVADLRAPIAAARDWLVATQTHDGGWGYALSEEEYSEIDGEALWAIVEATSVVGP